MKFESVHVACIETVGVGSFSVAIIAVCFFSRLFSLESEVAHVKTLRAPDYGLVIDSSYPLECENPPSWAATDTKYLNGYPALDHRTVAKLLTQYADMAGESSKAQQGTEGGHGNDVVKYCYETLATGVPWQVGLRETCYCDYRCPKIMESMLPCVRVVTVRCDGAARVSRSAAGARGPGTRPGRRRRPTGPSTRS
jgi:hypothetical protein